MNSTNAKDLSIVALIIAVLILIPVIYGAVKALPSQPVVETATSTVATTTTSTSSQPVVTGGGTSVSPVSKVPYIQYISPTSGQVGTNVTLLGSGFLPQGNTVIFGGDGSISNVTASQNGTVLTFEVPSQVAPHCDPGMMCAQYMRAITPGTYSVSLENANGTSNTFSFTVLPAPASEPSISSLSPSSGQVGMPVTIYGTGFLTTNTVLFDGGPVNASTMAKNGTALTFTVPNSVGADCQPGQACPMYARLVTNGVNTVSVRNVNGTSNVVNFTVTGGTTVVPNSSN